MLAALNRCEGDQPETYIREVGDAVTGFTGEAPQFDDMTMVGMTWRREKPEPTE